MKLALVVQRFGADVAGGSEAHCRQVAHRLGENHDVTVLTTCARDYISWKNHYRAGRDDEGKVAVHRFRCRRRRQQRFREISEVVFSGDGDDRDEEAWFRENGPHCPDLLDHLDRHGEAYDRVLFWTYRYATSYFGLQRVAERAVLLPTAEEDPAIRLRVLRRLFQTPAGFLFLTPEERQLVQEAAGGELPPCEVIGSGLDPVDRTTAAADDGNALLQDLGVASPYLLYLGRVDRNKGCETLFQYFLASDAARERRVQLALAGREAMGIPEHPSIVRLGFVSEEAREALLAHAYALVAPSLYESLCLVVLESWNHSRPVLVNGHCDVLRGQVLRANGGLYYTSQDEFGEALELLLERPQAVERLGSQGCDYVDTHYRWPIVMEKVERFLRDLPPSAS